MPSEPKRTAIERCIQWWEQCADERDGRTLAQARKELAALMKCREACAMCEDATRPREKCRLCNADAAATEAGL